jgi:hypothetical protein
MSAPSEGLVKKQSRIKLGKPTGYLCQINSYSNTIAGSGDVAIFCLAVG